MGRWCGSAWRRSSPASRPSPGPGWWPDSRGGCRSGSNWPRWGGPPKGTRPVRVGDSEFDRWFVVQANDPEMARDFLNAPVRWAIANLQRLGPPGGMLVSINPERLLVQVDSNLGLRPEQLASAVQEALALHDGLQSGVASRIGEGVAIVAAGDPAPEDAGPPTCKVCGEAIDGQPRVVCATCRTPHHRDCWEFVGGCSIFGCKGKTSAPR